MSELLITIIGLIFLGLISDKTRQKSSRTPIH